MEFEGLKWSRKFSVHPEAILSRFYVSKGLILRLILSEKQLFRVAFFIR